MSNTCRIGVGGPVGSGKTALIEAITPYFLKLGLQVLIITNDIVTTEDAKHVRKMLKGYLAEERIIGVETGACPHTAVREDPSMNIAAVEEMEARFPDGDVVLIESGGDNLTLTFSPALVDFFIYVIDVAAGDKIPRKDGPGISQSDILVINKTDTVKNQEDILTFINAYKDICDFAEIVPVSALRDKNTDTLLEQLFKYLPYGPQFYDEDTVTDQPMRQIAAELIREKALRLLDDEIPHGIAVVIEQMKERSNGIIDIEASIVCERESHKGIIIGKGGSMLKKIGTVARREIENMMETKVNLQLWVKVRKEWRDSELYMKNYGYDQKDV